MNSWPVSGCVAEDHRRHAHLVDLRAATLGNDLRQRHGNRLAHLGSRVVGSRRDRLVGRRIQAAALGHDQLDRVEEPLVLRDRRIHHAGDLRDHVAARIAEGRVGLKVVAIVRSGEVDTSSARRRPSPRSGCGCPRFPSGRGRRRRPTRKCRPATVATSSRKRRAA